MKVQTEDKTANESVPYENQAIDKKKVSSTPYDDVFKTLLNDCSSLIIPVINEVFHEHYRGDETITFHKDLHYMNGQDGEGEKRVTDNCFDILGETKKTYHVECQSTSDSSMLVRMFEYGTQIALDEGKIENDVMEVEFPHATVLFLRSNRNTPDKMRIHMTTPGGEVSYDIPVMKVQRYSLKEIFEKDLLFLIPFYIFTHESRLKEYNDNPEKLELLKNEYEYIKNKLEDLCKQYKIDAYTRCTISEMSGKVVTNLARKYENVKEGVKAVMGGQILEYEAKTILNKGIERGIEQGIERGIEQANMVSAQKMLLGNMEVSLIMEFTSLGKETVEKLKEEMIQSGQLKAKTEEEE